MHVGAEAHVSTSQPYVFALLTLTPSSRDHAVEPVTVHLSNQRQQCGMHCHAPRMCNSEGGREGVVFKVVEADIICLS